MDRRRPVREQRSEHTEVLVGERAHPLLDVATGTGNAALQAAAAGADVVSKTFDPVLLRTYLAVVNGLSFTRAAEQCSPTSVWTV